MNEKYPLALHEGAILAGQYIINSVLGQGGFGITYKATDYKTGLPVAVKEFFPDSMATRTTATTVIPFTGERGDSYEYGKNCFLQEARTLAEFVGNENIVRIHSFFEENGTAYFVMDYVEGVSFEEFIKSKGGRISYDEAENTLLYIIDALALVHSKGIVHRDVTPDNIFITNDGKVKLLDFGAARYSIGDKSRSLDVVLKHGFAPKEQYTRRGKQGPFTDVYTVGASFYFAITGKRPPDSIDRIDEDELIPPSSLGVQISPEKENAILKALAVQPGDRFQTMEEFKNALLSLRASNVQAAAQPVVAVPFSQPFEQDEAEKTVSIYDRPVMQDTIPNSGVATNEIPNSSLGAEAVPNTGMMSESIPNTGDDSSVGKTVPASQINATTSDAISEPYMAAPDAIPATGAESSVGKTVAASSINEPVVAQQPAEKKKKKWVLPVCLGGGVVAIAGIVAGVMLVLGGNKDVEVASRDRASRVEVDDDDDDRGSASAERGIEPTEAPAEPTAEPTAAPTAAPVVTTRTVGSFSSVMANNQANGGVMTFSGSDQYYYMPGDGLNWYDASGDVTTLDSSATYARNINVINNNQILFTMNGVAYIADRNGSNSRAFNELSGFDYISQMWANEYGAFIVSYDNSDYSSREYKLDYYSWDTGLSDYYYTIYNDRAATILGDYIYYIEKDGYTVSRMPLSTFGISSEAGEVVCSHSDYRFNYIVGDGNCLYFTGKYQDTPSVIRLDMTSERLTYVYGMVSKDSESLGTVNAANGKVYFVVNDTDWSSYYNSTLCCMTSSDWNSYSWSTLKNLDGYYWTICLWPSENELWVEGMVSDATSVAWMRMDGSNDPKYYYEEW